MKVLLKNGNVVEESFESAEGKKAFWHTSAHVLAQAVKRLYPNVKCGIGPAIEKGFYYDFEFDFPFSEENLGAVEDEMRKIIKESLSLQVYEVSKKEALKYMADNNEPYKQELIKELPAEEKISFYKQGDYAEFCAGPHIINTSHIKAVKLLSVAGAYWRGNEKNNVLTRIYGISFPKASELEEYLKLLEEAKRRDHRKLGNDLGLFLLMDEGPGFPFFLPKGLILKNTLIEYWRQVHKRYGYVEISTPIILNRDLWERSGHWTHYKDKMYTTVIDDMDYAIKPMNCPGGMLVYRSEQHSYRELPLRVGELGLVHRHELSGTLHGLFRVRCFTQDDAHIFMTREQMRDEIKNVIRLFDEVYSVFGLSYEIEVSTMPEDHMGDIETWDFATDTLKAACEDMGKSYVINEGDGAFYGPKLDFHLSDSLGRTWQCGTIQLDMQLPERFELEYVGADGKKHRPIMIHRVVFGSIERFIGIITEHFAGAFPLWIAPVQVEVLPVTDRAAEYAGGIVNKLQAAGFRAEADYRPEKLGYKIREAVGMKVPYMVIVGDKDIENRTISVRHRSGKDLGAMKYEDFESLIKEENDKKSL
ncbi:MAG: threonine--tRNA ligase [Lachnospiraceae bacterium]|nr:threonine--tRNA ligase [Lachnospiraceae bacterium]